MSNRIHIYCDESCHLLNDRQKVMVLGAVWCNATRRASIGRKIKALKKKHGLATTFEIKWTKVSPAKLDFYLSLVDLFFDDQLIHFRGLVVPDKAVLDHDRFGQTHDTFYYKMWYLLLTHLIDNKHLFRIFIDIKDTKGSEKVGRLHQVLCNTHYDFDQTVIQDIQLVHSHDVPMVQLADFLIGALAYLHRGLSNNSAKIAVIEQIRRRSGYKLLLSTPPRESKLNVFVWRPQTFP